MSVIEFVSFKMYEITISLKWKKTFCEFTTFIISIMDFWIKWMAGEWLANVWPVQKLFTVFTLYLQNRQIMFCLNISSSCQIFLFQL